MPQRTGRGRTRAPLNPKTRWVRLSHSVIRSITLPLVMFEQKRIASIARSDRCPLCARHSRDLACETGFQRPRASCMRRSPGRKRQAIIHYWFGRHVRTDSCVNHVSRVVLHHPPTVFSILVLLSGDCVCRQYTNSILSTMNPSCAYGIGIVRLKKRAFSLQRKQTSPVVDPMPLITTRLRRNTETARGE